MSAPSRFRVAKDPAPHWRDLWSSPRRAISASRDQEPESGKYLFARGRQAIYFALKGLGVQPGEAVLVPSFICDSVTAPILAAGVRVVFYRVRRDCSFDWPDIERRIQPGVRALIAVHYFGFAAAIRQCRASCDRLGFLMIEDCAHLLDGEAEGGPLGSFGDAAIFSWRKSLPLEDGGELVMKTVRAPLDIRWKRESALQTLKCAWHAWERIAEPRPSSVSQASPRQDSADRSGLGGANPLDANLNSSSEESAEETFSVEQSGIPISRVSRRLLRNADLGKCAAQRRENYRYLEAKLSLLNGVTLLRPSLPDGACPMLFPVFFDNFPNAHLALRAKGIPAVTWGGVRPSILDLREFPEAAFLYDNLVLLPVHQSLTRQDLDVIAEAAAAVRRERDTAHGTGHVFEGARNSAAPEASKVHS